MEEDETQEEESDDGGGGSAVPAGAFVEIDDVSEASEEDDCSTESDDIIIERVVDEDGVELPITPPASVGYSEVLPFCIKRLLGLLLLLHLPGILNKRVQNRLDSSKHFI